MGNRSAGAVAALLAVGGVGPVAAEECRVAFATCANGVPRILAEDRRAEPGRLGGGSRVEGPGGLATTVPEPASVLLLGAGLVAVAAVRHRRRGTPP